jgi:aspartyl-tRNA(Asn)/glutamyl-tRNA(Gln) amidotransferase subunit A
VQADEALSQARATDAKRARGEPLGRLAGVPIGLKDLLCTRDTPTTAGSRILTRHPAPGEAALDPHRGFRPPYDAHVVERLRAAGAILPGKCNMDEFAMGSSTENSAFFPARNPWDTTRSPGGSSGGSAVAVAAGMTPGALASDVRGAARLLEVIAGRDGRDSTSLDAGVGAYEAACGRDVKGLRIGVPEEYFAEGIDPVVAERVKSAIRGLRGLGCSLHTVHLPHTRYAVAAYYIIATAEASSNLARFDGVRYGLRVPPEAASGKSGGDLGALYDAARGMGFGREVKRRIMLGTYVLSAG